MKNIMKSNKVFYFLGILFVLSICFVPDMSFASLESSLLGIKSKLTGFVLPVLSVIGLLLAGFSFLTGSEKAKQHILYAIIGCVVGFGAQAIVDFLAQTVN
ncbi:MAG: hypothetical protein BroJett040_00710 [Oligoflexia bacterium]|nr:MAG: hypothetical protein BroJett040_00710 [Oligoflexia bacterium]